MLKYLKDQGRTSKVALWGRSMGASTVLMTDYTDCPLPVACIVCDSAFAAFHDIAMHIVEKMGLPKEMIEMMFP